MLERMRGPGGGSPDLAGAFLALPETMTTDETFADLRKAGADPNSREGEGNTPLLTAVIIRHTNSLKMVRLLLSRGANPMLANHNNKGLTPMHHAVARADTKMIDLIFAACPTALHAGAGKDGVTPLGLAVDVPVLSLPERERIIAHLISLGAADKDALTKEASALVRAVGQGKEVSSCTSFPATRRHVPVRFLWV